MRAVLIRERERETAYRVLLESETIDTNHEVCSWVSRVLTLTLSFQPNTYRPNANPNPQSTPA
eukprot:82609-Amorphochlora_amoeboformis.AAC.2